MTRLDRWGDPIEDEEPDPIHRCDGGWLGEDDQGRPIPCLTCRPHLERKSR